ncbi:MAG: glycoside hydrolase family 3 C-terminal domain-containing protein, partial [Muribaculum sp.]|nr:glycoside hydrolase family 3 C-terminal domain-containing protein [Muribaculum sp.]
LGLLDGDNQANPYFMSEAPAVAPFMTDYARSLAREAVAKSVVLLKNSPVGGGNPLLPLDKSKIKKIAVVGPYADNIVQDWYSGMPPYEVTILDGLKKAVEGTGIEVMYAPDNRMDMASRIAAEADVVIVCTGNHPYGTKRDWFFCPVPSDGREAVDRRSLMLPDEDMIRQLHAVNPNTVLLLVSSFPYAINWSNDNLPSILHVTHCAQEQGNGVADVLFGDVNPAGRTTQTWVRDILDLPSVMDYDIRNGHTYMYNRNKPLYPFGFGLSYTDFAYGDLSSRISDGNLVVDFSIANTGSRDGEEVAQLYLSVDGGDVYKLKAFRRLPIKAGDSEKVTFVMPLSELGDWNEAARDYAVLPGSKLYMKVGASSADTRLNATITTD